MTDYPILSRRFVLIVILLAITTISGCAGMRSVEVVTLPSPLHPPESVKFEEFSVPQGEDVVGRSAIIQLGKGDNLPDVARHFNLGITEISLANPGVDMWVPEAGTQIVLPLRFILPDVPRKGIVINLASMRLFHFRKDKEKLMVSTYPVGIGMEEKPTPMGRTYVERKVTRPTWYVPASIAAAHRKKGDILPPSVPPGPENPLGEYTLYLGKSGYLIHGTNKPASIGLKATNGCIRLYPEDIRELYRMTPVKTPVSIIYQPYLIGQRNGVVYLEVHTPVAQQKVPEVRALFSRLRNTEKRTKRAIDWGKVDKTLVEARGIPVSISENSTEFERRDEKPVTIRHPGKLFGRPEIPALKMNAWYVLAGERSNEKDAARLAAIINHQGPQIPARVLAKNGSHRVVAGPFENSREARAVVKRLKIDLDLDGTLIELTGNNQSSFTFSDRNF
jgi:L,D-transpeptidase ErfK/SrfK